MLSGGTIFCAGKRENPATIPPMAMQTQITPMVLCRKQAASPRKWHTHDEFENIKTLEITNTQPTMMRMAARIVLRVFFFLLGKEIELVSTMP
jgi:hypothetical protein